MPRRQYFPEAFRRCEPDGCSQGSNEAAKLFSECRRNIQEWFFSSATRLLIAALRLRRQTFRESHVYNPAAQRPLNRIRLAKAQNARPIPLGLTNRTTGMGPHQWYAIFM